MAKKVFSIDYAPHISEVFYKVLLKAMWGGWSSQKQLSLSFMFWTLIFMVVRRGVIARTVM